ncbi:MAG: endolytic transglycosylase MltG [Chitinophagaceae bacterium]
MRKQSRGKGFSKKPILRIIGFVVLGIALLGAYFVFGPNTGSLAQGEYLFVHTGSDYNAVKTALKDGGFIGDIKSFDLLAKEVNYPNHIHPGRYHITRGMSNWRIVRLLRSGKQSPVKLVIKKLRTKDDFIHLIGSNLEADSTVLRQMLSDDNYLAQFGLDSSTALCAVMPNTYDFYWNTNADKAFRKIETSFFAFWNAKRKAAADSLHLTPQQAVILASIVTEESNKYDEQPDIARVYLNRMAKGMKLQADPTAKYATGDFALKRITSAQTSIASPYNTYYVLGLPPGPICTPDARTIEAVLASPKSNYLYFCAKADFSGYHSFAATYTEHLKNAQAYQQALNERAIH